MRNLVHRCLFALGLIIALFGASADYILPTSSPGLNLPQLLVIAAGLSLAWGAGRLARGLREHGGKAIVIALFTLLALELILTAVGTTVYFPTEVSNNLSSSSTGGSVMMIAVSIRPASPNTVALASAGGGLAI